MPASPRARSSSPGVGKTREELEYAVGLDVSAINAESPGELDRIGAIAAAMGRTARVALRVNPDIDAKSHPNISTGLKTNKFGVALEDARGIYADRRSTPGLQFVGVHVHIGSQITTAEPLARAARTLVTWRSNWRTTACGWSTSIWAEASAWPMTAHRS